VCESPSEYLCPTPNEHSRTSTLHHYRCSGCGMVFVGDAIDEEELQEAYASLDTGAYYTEIRTQNLKKFRTSLADLSSLADKTSRIIDIGTGDGEFLEVLLEAGFARVSGHEIPGSDLSRIERRGCTTYRDFDYASIPANGFDVVTFLDVAEHVLDPQHLFTSCNRILRERGILYFHVPLVTPLDRLMHRMQQVPVLRSIGRIWQRSRTSVFHLQNFTGKSLTLLLERAGFVDISLVARNELSWPVTRYLRVYLCEKHGLPQFLAPVLAALVYPVLGSKLLNANKAIVWARKRGTGTSRN